MSPSSSGASPSAKQLASAAVVLAKKWVDESAGQTANPAAERLAQVLKDPNGLDFTLGFVDGVMRPEDLFVAGYNLQEIARIVPDFLPWYLKSAVKAGGVLGPVVPAAVIPVARRVLRQMVGHLVVDASAEKLGPAIAELRDNGSRLNLNLLGEAVLGEAEAAKRLEGTRELLARDDVDYVSIKVSSIASQLSMWSFPEAVNRVVKHLTPLYELAAASGSSAGWGAAKFINLDMEEYRDLDLTIAVFTKLLDQPQLRHLEAGIVLQAYLPDAFVAMQTLQDWAAARVASGGASIKVRLVKGANLAMERVDATIHGWPPAPYDSKLETDANYKRILMWALTPERAATVKLGVAGHNLFDLAFAWELAKARGVTGSVEFEMLLGMATAQAEAVKREVGSLLLYTPVVHPHEFDVAISYLVRRLEENASDENFMSAVFELHDRADLFEREKRRFLDSVTRLEATPHDIPFPRRVQNRETEWTLEAADDSVVPKKPEVFTRANDDEDEGMTQQVLGLSRGSRTESPFDTTRVFDTSTLPAMPATELGAPGFVNAPDTDPALAANRAWARRILARIPASELGNETVAGSVVSEADELEDIIRDVRDSGEAWGAKPAADRAAILARAGLALAANRDRLIEVMAAETGKTIGEADPEVSEAIDFAHYYAAKARELDSIRGARFVPSALTVVTPPWNFPVAIPAGGVLAALAAGSGVIIKPAHQSRRSAAVMVEALWEAGVPRAVLRFVTLDEGELGKQLVAHPDVDRVILTGAWETAKLFRSWRFDLPLMAETSGKNAIIVTPSADLDLAAADVVRSAFGHAGQKCSAASLVILVGSVARSDRFRRQLVDAARSMRVGYPDDPRTQIGPVIEPVSGKLEQALTELGLGERWLLKPEKLDESGRLWSPGIRADVVPGSPFHLTEYFGPVLGVMHAATLGDAIRQVNAIDYGLTSGLHTQNPDDLAEWLAAVEAGNLYVNRGITGAIVQRQPFGGWKRSAVGAGAKAGGPNYLLTLGSWQPDAGSSSKTLHLRGLDARVTRIIESAQPSLDYEAFDLLRRAALSDAIAWGNEYGEITDVSALALERNLFRYRAVPVEIRATTDAALGEVLRVVVAAIRSRSRFTLSLASSLPVAIRNVLAEFDVPVAIETDVEWIERTTAPDTSTGRVRIVGTDDSRAVLATALAATVGGDPDLAIYAGAVTHSGRIELLPFLHEQAISITAHRFGNPDPWSEDVI